LSCIEHFRALDMLPPIMADDCLVVLYVNKEPYDRDRMGSHGYDQYDTYDFKLWMDARAKFYRVISPARVTEEEALLAYRRYFASRGFMVKQILAVPCYSDVEAYPPYAFRVAFSLKAV
jgi:hypothetical protein